MSFSKHESAPTSPTTSTSNNNNNNNSSNSNSQPLVIAYQKPPNPSIPETFSTDSYFRRTLNLSDHEWVQFRTELEAIFRANPALQTMKLHGPAVTARQSFVKIMREQAQTGLSLAFRQKFAEIAQEEMVSGTTAYLVYRAILQVRNLANVASRKEERIAKREDKAEKQLLLQQQAQQQQQLQAQQAAAAAAAAVQQTAQATVPPPPPPPGPPVAPAPAQTPVPAAQQPPPAAADRSSPSDSELSELDEQAFVLTPTPSNDSPDTNANSADLSALRTELKATKERLAAVTNSNRNLTARKEELKRRLHSEKDRSARLEKEKAELLEQYVRDKAEWEGKYAAVLTSSHKKTAKWKSMEEDQGNLMKALKQAGDTVQTLTSALSRKRSYENFRSDDD